MSLVAWWAVGCSVLPGSAENRDHDKDGFTPAMGDCDDEAANVYPGAADAGGDEVDADCDGTDGVDADQDGAASIASGGADCDDQNPAITPFDEDGDGLSVCDQDCDDAEPAVAPGASETCDGLDNDCDGAVDLGSGGDPACARVEAGSIAWRKLDLLWVVDNTSDMVAVQGALTDIADTLVAGLAGVDYHVGVVTTDMEFQPGRLIVSSGYEWLDPETPDPEGWLRAVFGLGITGSSVERGLDAAQTALDTNGQTWNAGFERPEADLAVVVSSTEADQSDVTMTEFELWFASWKAPPATATFHAHTNCDGSGTDYLSLAATFGGEIWSTCDLELTDEAEALLTSIVPPPPSYEFVLAEPADPASIEVEVVSPEGEVDGLPAFTYDEGTRTLTFTGRRPAPGSTFTIRYLALPMP